MDPPVLSGKKNLELTSDNTNSSRWASAETHLIDECEVVQILFGDASGVCGSE